METLGKNIANRRKMLHLTQEELADKLGVSAQAVSKWENDISIPDISLLINLANLFETSLDELVRNKEPETRLLAKEIRKSVDKMVIRLVINSSDGDKIKINLPMALVKLGIAISGENSMKIGNVDLKNIDFDQVLEMASLGVIGKLLEIESTDGDVVEIYAE